MAPALWALSLPAGFFLCFFARLFSLTLQVKCGVPLKNEYPRAQPGSKEVAMKDTDGYVRRSYAAHQNTWEALILWVAAVLFAKIMGVDEDQMNCTAAVWLTCRVIYFLAYTFITTHKVSFFRTAVFSVGMASSFHLLWTAAQMA